MKSFSEFGTTLHDTTRLPPLPFGQQPLGYLGSTLCESLPSHSRSQESYFPHTFILWQDGIRLSLTTEREGNNTIPHKERQSEENLHGYFDLGLSTEPEGLCFERWPSSVKLRGWPVRNLRFLLLGSGSVFYEASFSSSDRIGLGVYTAESGF